MVDSFKQTVKKNKQRESVCARPILRRTQSERFSKAQAVKSDKASLPRSFRVSPKRKTVERNSKEEKSEGSKTSSKTTKKEKVEPKKKEEKESKGKKTVSGEKKEEKKPGKQEAEGTRSKGKEKETEKGQQKDKESQAQILVQELRREASRVHVTKNASHTAMV